MQQNFLIFSLSGMFLFPLSQLECEEKQYNTQKRFGTCSMRTFSSSVSYFLAAHLPLMDPLKCQTCLRFWQQSSSSSHPHKITKLHIWEFVPSYWENRLSRNKVASHQIWCYLTEKHVFVLGKGDGITGEEIETLVNI